MKNNTKVFCLFTICFLVLPFEVFADVKTLSTVRVTYRPDDGVSVTTFIASACLENESESQCIDRLYGKILELKGMPYEDMDSSKLPQDEANRDKWRGEKGKGIWVDNSLITKTEKLAEFQAKLDAELAKPDSDSVQVARLQRQIEKLKAMSVKNNILTKENIAELNKISGNSGTISFWTRIKSFFAGLFK